MIFVCWLFHGRRFDRSRVMRYQPEHVRVLASMLRRHGGHDLVCVTDQAAEVGQHSGVRVIDMPAEVSALPRYYPKLWAFSREFGKQIGQRFASIDLDVVITGDLAAVLEPFREFGVWDQARGEHYNTSLFVLEPGARAEVWEQFDLDATAQAEANASRWTGDQSWVGHVLGADQPTFSEAVGVIQYRPSLHREARPANCLAAFMCGPYIPDIEAKQSAWVRGAYQ